MKNVPAVTLVLGNITVFLILVHGIHGCGRPIKYLDKDGKFIDANQRNKDVLAGQAQKPRPVLRRPSLDPKQRLSPSLSAPLPMENTETEDVMRQELIKDEWYPTPPPWRLRIKRRPLHPSQRLQPHPGGEILCN